MSAPKRRWSLARTFDGRSSVCNMVQLQQLQDESPSSSTLRKREVSSSDKVDKLSSLSKKAKNKKKQNLIYKKRTQLWTALSRVLPYEWRFREILFMFDRDATSSECELEYSLMHPVAPKHANAWS